MSSSEGMQGRKRPNLPNENRTEALSEVSSSTATELPATTSDKSIPARTYSVFLNFSFFKIDPKWRWLNELGKEEAAKEFTGLIEVANTKMRVRVYSTLGLREDSEFMLWMISESIEKMQILTSKIYLTVFGKYIESSKVYLSSYRPSLYSRKTEAMPGYLLDVNKKENAPKKYAIVYPFVKSREWYLLPFEDRMQMMEEHIVVGRKFPQVRINTSYSFGIGDQDFMLAFETDDLMVFQDLIVQLRETRVSKYVIKDTPMMVCIYKGNVEEFIKSLG